MKKCIVSLIVVLSMVCIVSTASAEVTKVSVSTSNDKVVIDYSLCGTLFNYTTVGFLVNAEQTNYTLQGSGQITIYLNQDIEDGDYFSVWWFSDDEIGESETCTLYAGYGFHEITFE
jgi:hypothetical protein